MKKVFAITLGVLFLASCNSKPEGFTLNGTVRGGLDNGTQIFLKTTDSTNQLVDIDTTAVENGLFSFNGEQEEPKLHYIFIGSGRGNIPFVLENGDIEIKFQKDSLTYADLKGSLQNELYMDFLSESRKLSEMAMSMRTDLQAASTKQDTATVAALQEEYLELQEEAKNLNVDYARENPNALISVLILGNLSMRKAITNDEIQKIYDAFTPEMKATTPGKQLKEQLDKSKNTDIGSRAPEFEAPTPNGDLLALNDVKGKLTLVDFWAAWCRPCRAENPNIVSVYNKYHDKGLNVIGVSLDTRAEDWKNAIESDGLAWNHISNLKRFQDPVAQLYNINAIPAAFLLDENGVIVAKDLRGEALEQKVAELLN
ncbi:MAG: TlpA disulfide reductase family protein [Flavobacteriaceae bacterium]